MDEHDFDQILQTDFHPNTAPTLAHHDHQQDDQEMREAVDGQQQHADDVTRPEGEEQERAHFDLPAGALDSSSIGPLPLSPSPSHLAEELPSAQDDVDEDEGAAGPSSTGATTSAAEKKRKQRELNRLAAKRSRRKRQGQLGEVEQEVRELVVENEELRARLNTLQAARSGVAASTSASASPATETLPLGSSKTLGIRNLSGSDHSYLRRFVTDLAGLKNQLIAKELELDHARARTGEIERQQPSEEVLRLRSDLTEKAANLVMLQAEESAMKGMIKQLGLEKEYLRKQRDRISGQADARAAIKQINDVDTENQDAPGAQGGTTTAVDRVLSDVRGVLDETIAKWDELDPVDKEDAQIDPQLAA